MIILKGVFSIGLIAIYFLLDSKLGNMVKESLYSFIATTMNL